MRLEYTLDQADMLAYGKHFAKRNSALQKVRWVGTASAPLIILFFLVPTYFAVTPLDAPTGQRLLNGFLLLLLWAATGTGWFFLIKALLNSTMKRNMKQRYPDDYVSENTLTFTEDAIRLTAHRSTGGDVEEEWGYSDVEAVYTDELHYYLSVGGRSIVIPYLAFHPKEQKGEFSQMLADRCDVHT